MMSRRPLLRRRTILAAAAAVLGGAGPDDSLRLRPGIEPVRVATEPASGEIYRIWIEGCGDPLEVPALRARRLPDLPVAGRNLLAIAFGADLPGAQDQDVVTLAGWDGARLRILALETLTWRRADGAAFHMRLAATPERAHVALGCLAHMARPVTRPFSRVWTDLLAWQDGAPFADALPRPPLAGSWQADMRATRRLVASFLAEPRTSLSAEDLATSGILAQFGCMADT